MNKNWNNIFNNSIGALKDMSIEAKRMVKNVRTLSLHEIKEHNDRAYAEMTARREYLDSKKSPKNKE